MEEVKFEDKGIGIQGIYASTLLSLNQDIRIPKKNEGDSYRTVNLRREEKEANNLRNTSEVGGGLELGEWKFIGGVKKWLPFVYSSTEME